MDETLLQFEPIAVGYWGAFAVTALVCFAALSRALDIENAEVRYGIVGLLATTGIWSLFKVVYFVFPDLFRRPAYTIGLVFGFATVWAWLYFCSAYTGRSYHKNPTIRRLSAGAFLAVVLVKLTNPVHGLYFTTSVSTTPFEYLAIEHGLFHWAVTGFSYALAAIGVFMLFELYLESGYNTRPLAILTGILCVPVGLDVAAMFTDALIEVIYAPIGVAAFTLGVLYFFERRFLAIQSAGDDDSPAVFLDDSGMIRDYTPAAETLFPQLEGAVSHTLDEVLPKVAAIQDEDENIIEYESDKETQYLMTTASSIRLGDSQGTVLLFSDVTTAETRRRELQRHNEQLEGFATALAHELRNMLQIIEWRLGIAADRTTPESVEHESIRKAAEANKRLSARVDDFTRLAKYGQTVDRQEPVEFGVAVDDAWWNVETDDLELTVTQRGEIYADPGRLRELLGNLFVFARLNGAETVTVELLEDGFAVADDGEPPTDDIDGYLAFGESVPTAEAGMKLPNAKTFAHVHGWTIDIDTAYQDGVRVVIAGATTELEPPTENPVQSTD